jgi:hypothetical protein
MTLLDNIKYEKQIIKEIMLVTKSPCLHPGDIQKVIGVDRPELHHLENVIVRQNQPSFRYFDSDRVIFRYFLKKEIDQSQT